MLCARSRSTPYLIRSEKACSSIVIGGGNYEFRNVLACSVQSSAEESREFNLKLVKGGMKCIRNNTLKKHRQTSTPYIVHGSHCGQLGFPSVVLLDAPENMQKIGVRCRQPRTRNFPSRNRSWNPGLEDSGFVRTQDLGIICILDSLLLCVHPLLQLFELKF